MPDCARGSVKLAVTGDRFGVTACNLISVGPKGRKTMQCPKCAYVRQPADNAAEGECPRCGIIYAKFRPPAAPQPRQATAASSSPNPEFTQTPETFSDDTKQPDNPWSFIGGGAFLFAVAWWLNHVLTNLEMSGGTIRINAIVALLYKAFGKPGAVGLFVVFGVLAIFIGIRDLRKSQ